MKLKILKLGTMVTDKVTNTLGMLTHLSIDMDLNHTYVYQPRGLNPKTMQPVDTMWIVKSRILGGEEITVDLPTNIIGSHVEDMASGYQGTIIGLDYHINGCIHADVKPSGILEETGGTIGVCNFDIRRLKGDLIKPLEGKELEKSLVEDPSPADMPEKNRG